MFRSPFPLTTVVLLAAAAVPASGQDPAAVPPRIYGDVAVSATHVAFAFAGQIWEVPRAGGTARRVTAGPEDHGFPLYAPDGSRLAYTRGAAIWASPASGREGEATRLTWFPRIPFPRAWHPDGKTILFSSARDGDGNIRALTVPADGGPETLLPIWPVRFASYAPDGRRLAIVGRSIFLGGVDRRYYRGGARDPIEIVDPTTGVATAITSRRANAIFPMWIGSRIYYASDTLGSFNLAVYETTTRRTRLLTRWRSHGITSAGASGNAIAFVRDGRIHLYDLATGRIATPAIAIPADTTELVPRSVAAAQFVGWALPGGAGHPVAIESRGDVLLVDPATGAGRNLTNTPGVAERQPVLSPDGRQVAWFSDAGGEYALVVAAADGGSPRTIALGPRPTYFRGLSWSPDGRRVAFSDQRLVLWVADLAEGRAAPVDSSRWIAQGLWQTSWSPDGRWLAYAKANPKGIRSIWLRDVEAGRAWPVSQGGSQDVWPVFDPTGRWLYFTSSAVAGNAPAAEVWSLLSDLYAQPQVVHRLMVTALRKGDVLPILPFGLGPNPAAAASANRPIDPEGASTRVAPLSFPPRPVEQLWATPAGALLVQVRAWGKAPFDANSTSELLRVDPRAVGSGALATLGEGLRGVEVSQDGRAILLARQSGYALLGAEQAVADAKPLDLAKVTVQVEPRAEWGQMYREAMRMMRDYFYDPGHHGADVAALERHYAAYLPGLTRRADLNALLNLAFGEISVSHLQVGGGDIPRAAVPSERIGVLGADFRIEHGHFRFQRVYRNAPYQSESPLTRAPLDQPGAEVADGEYLLAVDGTDVTADRPVDFFLVGKGGRPTTLRVGPSPDGAGARDVTVIPTSGDNGLRRANWVEANRREVERRSNGRLAYVHVSGWNPSGIAELSRALNGNPDARGLIIDERWNGGGITPDAAVEWLLRTPIYDYLYRYGDGFAVPHHLIEGPKVLIAHESNGSAAETFALMFQERKVGTIVGQTTVGGGIGGALYYQPLSDGGRVVIPNRASHNSRLGVWGVENEGVVPDVPVRLTQADAAAGRDPQLARAIEIALRALATHRPTVGKRPPMPVHPPRDPEP